MTATRRTRTRPRAGSEEAPDGAGSGDSSSPAPRGQRPRRVRDLDGPTKALLERIGRVLGESGR